MRKVIKETRLQVGDKVDVASLDYQSGTYTFDDSTLAKITDISSRGITVRYLEPPYETITLDPKEVPIQKFSMYEEDKPMRKVEKEKQEVIAITQDVKVAKDTILEKGDRIEILGKEKVEEQKLKESHFLSNLGPEFSTLLTSAAENGVEYVSRDLAELFDYFAMDFEEVDHNITKLLKDLAKAAERWAR